MKMMKLNRKIYYMPETEIVRLQYADSLMDGEGWALKGSPDMAERGAPARVAPAQKLYL